jgi:hypothetical protein
VRKRVLAAPGWIIASRFQKFIDLIAGLFNEAASLVCRRFWTGRSQKRFDLLWRSAHGLKSNAQHQCVEDFVVERALFVQRQYVDVLYLCLGMLADPRASLVG